MYFYIEFYIDFSTHWFIFHNTSICFYIELSICLYYKYIYRGKLGEISGGANSERIHWTSLNPGATIREIVQILQAFEDIFKTLQDLKVLTFSQSFEYLNITNHSKFAASWKNPGLFSKSFESYKVLNNSKPCKIWKFLNLFSDFQKLQRFQLTQTFLLRKISWPIFQNFQTQQGWKLFFKTLQDWKDYVHFLKLSNILNLSSRSNISASGTSHGLVSCFKSCMGFKCFPNPAGFERFGKPRPGCSPEIGFYKIWIFDFHPFMTNFKIFHFYRISWIFSKQYMTMIV